MTIVVPITGLDQYEGYPLQVVVKAHELGPGGEDSVIECGHLRTIDRRIRIDADRGVLVHLTDETMSKVDGALRSNLAL